MRLTQAIAAKALLFGTLVGGVALAAPTPAQAQRFGVAIQFGPPAYGYGPAPYAYRYGYGAWRRHEAWVRHQEWINAHRFYGRPYGYGPYYR